MKAYLDHLRSFLGWVLERHAGLGGVTELRILGGQRRGVFSALVGPGDLDEVVQALVSQDLRSAALCSSRRPIILSLGRSICLERRYSRKLLVDGRSRTGDQAA